MYVLCDGTCEITQVNAWVGKVYVHVTTVRVKLTAMSDVPFLASFHTYDPIPRVKHITPRTHRFCAVSGTLCSVDIPR